MLQSPLNQRIKDFYDRSTRLWLNTWGEHMHHGFYGADGQAKKDHKEAQIDMIKELIQWADINKPSRILDAGCGVGGSARFLSEQYQANVLGVTLSPVQAESAKHYNKNAGLENRITVQARDLFDVKKEDGPFDLIWSLESAEHMPDKPNLLQLFYDILEPGGKFVMATWCHRNTDNGLTEKEKKLLEKVCKLYHLPPWVSIDDYQTMAQQAGFQDIKTDDWSQAVAPFWNAVIRSAFSRRGLMGLLQSSWSTIQGAWAMQYMTRGYRMGVIKFGVMTGRKV